MGRYVTRITHKGKQMLFMDTAGMGEEEGIGAWAEMKQELQNEKGACLILVDSANITMAPEMALCRRRVYTGQAMVTVNSEYHGRDCPV